MQFSHTICYVENVGETLKFYCSAFGFEQKFLHESGDYGELDTGSTTLAFSSLKLMHQIGKNASSPDSAKPTFEIAFTVEDVQKAMQTANEAGAQTVQEASQMPWGQTIGYVLDNNGFMIEICTPVGA